MKWREFITLVGGAAAAWPLAAKAATTTIPVVFFVGPEPVRLGLVASLARPGGNITGATTLNEELVAKRMELMHEAIPKATSFALLVNPTSPNLARCKLSRGATDGFQNFFTDTFSTVSTRPGREFHAAALQPAISPRAG